LLQRGGDGVDVVGHATQYLAVRPPVVELERQARELSIDILTQIVDAALGHPGHDVLLDVGEERADQIERDQQQYDTLDAAEIQTGDGLMQLRRGELGHDALEDGGGDLAQQLGPDDVEHRAEYGKDEDDDELPLMGLEIAHQPQERAPEV